MNGVESEFAFQLISPKMDLGVRHGKTDAFFSLENPPSPGNAVTNFEVDLLEKAGIGARRWNGWSDWNKIHLG